MSTGLGEAGSVTVVKVFHLHRERSIRGLSGEILIALSATMTNTLPISSKSPDRASSLSGGRRRPAEVSAGEADDAIQQRGIVRQEDRRPEQARRALRVLLGRAAHESVDRFEQVRRDGVGLSGGGGPRARLRPLRLRSPVTNQNVPATHSAPIPLTCGLPSQVDRRKPAGLPALTAAVWRQGQAAVKARLDRRPVHRRKLVQIGKIANVHDCVTLRAMKLIARVKRGAR